MALRPHLLITDAQIAKIDAIKAKVAARTQGGIQSTPTKRQQIAAAAAVIPGPAPAPTPASAPLTQPAPEPEIQFGEMTENEKMMKAMGEGFANMMQNVK